MKKFYVSNVEELNELEKKTGCVSYRRIIERYIDNLVLCNKIEEIDELVWECMKNIDFDSDEEINIYQYYLCDLTELEKEMLLDYGIILSYSNVLDLDVLCVDHLGTSWDYVMTDVKWSTNYEECK